MNNLEISNVESIDLWTILSSYVQDSKNELIRSGYFKKDGTVSKHGYHWSEYIESLIRMHHTAVTLEAQLFELPVIQEWYNNPDDEDAAIALKNMQGQA